MLTGFAELTLETRDRDTLERFYTDAFGTEDPEGNVVEVWDFFRQGKGRREGVKALA